MSYYQPGTFGNIQLYRFLNTQYGVKTDSATRAALFNHQINTTAPFTFNPTRAPQAASAAIGRMSVGCCSECEKASK